MSEIQQSVVSENPGDVRYRVHKTLVMVGMMGAGKTAVGKALAARLAVQFLDSDAEIERAANMSVPEIFSRDGEPFFRDKEAQVIARLLDGTPCVLSTGGGAYLAKRNRTAISAHGIAVWLDADLDLLWSRVRHKTTRPLLNTPDPFGSLSDIYTVRVPIYAKADPHVKADPSFAIEDMVDRVITALLARPDVLETD